MGWQTRSGGGTIVKLGDKEGQVREVTGVFTGSRPGDYDKPLYDFSGEGGEKLTLPHNAALEGRLTDADVGKLVRVVFVGWGTNKKGQNFKDITVHVWGNDPYPADLLKRFPALSGGVAAPPAARAASKPEDSDDDEDDDLPF